MDLPIRYLHLETVILLIFLAMMTWTQLQRASESGYYTQFGKIQAAWFIALFCVLVLFFAAALAKVSPLLAVELAAGFTLSLLHPANALCFFVHLLFLRPWEIVRFNLPPMAGLGILCMVSWIIHPSLHGKPNVRTFRILMLLFAFSAWLFLTTFQSSNISETQADWFGTYFKSLIVFVMSVYFIESERSVTQFKWTLVMSVLALMVIRSYQVYIKDPAALVRLETGGMFGNSNDLAAIIVMTLPFALVRFFQKTANLLQQLAGLLYGWLSVLVIWYSQSRGAMLALVVQILTVCYLKTNGKKRLGMLLLAGLLCAGYITAIKALPRNSADMQESAEGRIGFWQVAIKLTLRHPISGVGYGQFSENVWQHMTAHSSWFLAFAESGIPGGILFVSYFVMISKIAWRNRGPWPDHFYAIAGYGVTMTFLSHTYLMYLYLLAGLIMASDSLRDRPDNEY
ncbi:MAG: O-antigen ligase family protein [Elusimicrobiota bacterium]